VSRRAARCVAAFLRAPRGLTEIADKRGAVEDVRPGLFEPTAKLRSVDVGHHPELLPCSPVLSHGKVTDMGETLVTREPFLKTET